MQETKRDKERRKHCVNVEWNQKTEAAYQIIDIHSKREQFSQNISMLIEREWCEVKRK